MWEVLTRKQPFAGRNFMGVPLDVLEGRWPAIPNDCGREFACRSAGTQSRRRRDPQWRLRLDGLIEAV